MINPPTSHCHIFASLDSASTIEAFAKRETELGTGYLTATDHGTMAACLDTYDVAKKSGLKPILGCEIYFRDDNCEILKKHGIDPGEDGTYKHYNKYYHLILAAQDQDAYHALIRNLSVADMRAEVHGSERKPLFTWNQLEELGGYNISFTSGCLVGAVSRHLLSDQKDIAVAYYDKLRSLPKKGNFYTAIFPHDCSKNWDKAVYVTLEGGEKQRFYVKKKLRTNAGEVYAEDMARAPLKHKTLYGMMNNRKWVDVEPKAIVKVEAVEGFIPNECTDFAPDGDMQNSVNKFMIELANKYGDKIVIEDDCLVAGTGIRTQEGPRPVETIKRGDYVMTHKGRYRKVEAVREVVSNKRLVTLFGKNFSVTATEGHRFYVKRNENIEWIPINEICITDQGFRLSFGPSDPEFNWVDITSISIKPSNQTVYDLQVAEDHSFFANGICCHNCHFATPDTKIIQDMKLGGRGGTWRMYGSYHRQSGQEMFDFFKAKLGINQAQFDKWANNNKEYASKFDNFELKYNKELPTKFYPGDSLSNLFRLINKHGRMDWNNSEMVSRLKAEIAMLHDNGTIDLIPYFFPIEEIVEKAIEHGEVAGVGRGSAAGLLLSYLLGITHVDPLRYGLSMERFITLDRIQAGALPDIDQDFSDREWLIDPENGYLRQKFGDHYAPISTYVLLHVKSAIKDICRAKRGFVLPEIEELTKKIPNTPQGVTDESFLFGYTSDDGEEVPGLVETCDPLQEYIRKFPDDWELVKKAVSVLRTSSRHACLPATEMVRVDEEIGLEEIVKCNQKMVVTGQGTTAKATLLIQGTREVMEYTLENGKKIRCTPDHLILTVEGWLPISEAHLRAVSIVIR